MDALALAAVGNSRAVAVGGRSAPDPGQLPEALRVIVAPDDDEAGRKALELWTEAVRQAGLSPYWLKGHFGPYKDLSERWAAGLDARVGLPP